MHLIVQLHKLFFYYVRTINFQDISRAGVLGSIPSQGPRHTKAVIKMVPVVSLFSTEHSKGKILALSQELR